MQPLFRGITGQIDWLFFSEHFDRERKLKQLGYDLLQAKNADEFNRIILTGIVSCFNAVRVSFFLLNESEKIYVLQSAVGWGTQWGKDALTRMELSEPVERYLEHTSHGAITMTEIMHGSSVSGAETRLALYMLRLEATLAVPILADGHLNGLLILGDKESGLPYETEDFDALKTLSGQMSIVLENLDLLNKWSHEQRQSSKLGEVLHRYMSSSVADEILTRVQDQKAWKGDRRHVAVLMSDLRNFTSISESHPPEEIMQSLNDYLLPMTEIILSAGGSVDKFIGDAILVVFGAPVEMPDAEARAVRCALDMQQSVDSLNKTRLAQGLFEFEMGIGITAGEVVAGNLGSHRRMEYTVIGDPVNLASRLQGMAKGGQILVTADIAQKVQNDVTVRNLGTIPVKGKKHPVEIFQVVNPLHPAHTPTRLT
jgi:class 3 adenylate cyclase